MTTLAHTGLDLPAIAPDQPETTRTSGMRVEVASLALCWGIDLALKRIGKAAPQGLDATHRWAHKPQARRWDPLEFVRRGDPHMLQRYPGLERVRVVESLVEATAGRVALGHHGTVEPLAAAGANRLLDYTCPFIARSDSQAEALADAGFDLVLFGKQGNHHCEFAKAAAVSAGRTGVIGESVAELLDVLREPGRQWACLGQVTANVERWQQFKADLQASGVPVRMVDTVCSDSHDRQGEGRRLAGVCDVVLVVDDHGGSTQSLFEQCLAVNPRTHRHDWLAKPSPDPALFEGARSAAVIGGIHVPDWILGEVAQAIERMAALQPT